MLWDKSKHIALNLMMVLFVYNKMLSFFERLLEINNLLSPDNFSSILILV